MEIIVSVHVGSYDVTLPVGATRYRSFITRSGRQATRGGHAALYQIGLQRE
jgi:hypothetical protein